MDTGTKYTIFNLLFILMLIPATIDKYVPITFYPINTIIEEIDEAHYLEFCSEIEDIITKGKLPATFNFYNDRFRISKVNITYYRNYKIKDDMYTIRFSDEAHKPKRIELSYSTVADLINHLQKPKEIKGEIITLNHFGKMKYFFSKRYLISINVMLTKDKFQYKKDFL